MKQEECKQKSLEGVGVLVDICVKGVSEEENTYYSFNIPDMTESEAKREIEDFLKFHELYLSTKHQLESAKRGERKKWQNRVCRHCGFKLILTDEVIKDQAQKHRARDELRNRVNIILFCPSCNHRLKSITLSSKEFDRILERTGGLK